MVGVGGKLGLHSHPHPENKKSPGEHCRRLQERLGRPAQMSGRPPAQTGPEAKPADKRTGAGALGTALLQRGDLAPPTTGVPGRGWATGHPTGEGECLSCPPPLAVTGPSAPGGQKPWDAQGAGDRVAAPSAPRGGTGWPQTRAQGGGRGPGWDPPHLAGCTLSMACWSSLYSTWAVERLSTNLSTASLSLLYM